MSHEERKARKKARIPTPIKPAKIPTAKRGKVSNKPLSLETIQAVAAIARAKWEADSQRYLGERFGR